MILFDFGHLDLVIDLTFGLWIWDFLSFGFCHLAFYSQYIYP